MIYIHVYIYKKSLWFDIIINLSVFEDRGYANISSAFLTENKINSQDSRTICQHHMIPLVKIIRMFCIG